MRKGSNLGEFHRTGLRTLNKIFLSNCVTNAQPQAIIYLVMRLHWPREPPLRLATCHKSDFFLRYPCNVRPTCEAIKTKRISSRPIFQPKCKKAAPTSVRQPMLSTACKICLPSPQKHAPSSKSANPMIAARMIVMPNKQKSIARTRYSKSTYHSLVFPDALLATAREGNTPSKLLSCFYGYDGTKFPKD